MMLDWIKSYGVLGLEGVDPRVDPWVAPRVGIPLRQHEGQRESLRGFLRASRRAAWCLGLYEAATAPDGPDAEALERHGAGGDTLEGKKEWAVRALAKQVGDRWREEEVRRVS